MTTLIKAKMDDICKCLLIDPGLNISTNKYALDDFILTTEMKEILLGIIATAMQSSKEKSSREKHRKCLKELIEFMQRYTTFCTSDIEKRLDALKSMMLLYLKIHIDSMVSIVPWQRFTLDRERGVKVIAKSSIRENKTLQITGLFCPLPRDTGELLSQENKDFSIMTIKKGKDLLLLGPASLLNHDCNSNCRYMKYTENSLIIQTPWAKRSICVGEELTVYYDQDYFDVDNVNCECRTCEITKRGAYRENGKYRSDSAEDIADLDDSLKSFDDFLNYPEMSLDDKLSNSFVSLERLDISNGSIEKSTQGTVLIKQPVVLINALNSTQIHRKLEESVDPAPIDLKLTKKRKRKDQQVTFNFKQVLSMSATQLVKFFSLHKDDELKKKYTYTCALVPGCKQNYTSYASETKAKKSMFTHLTSHLDSFKNDAEAYTLFTAVDVKHADAISFSDVENKKPKIQQDERTHTKCKIPGGHENVAEQNELAEIQLVQKTQKWTKKYPSDKTKTITKENMKATIQQDEATHSQDEADKKDCLSTKTPTIRIQNETQVEAVDVKHANAISSSDVENLQPLIQQNKKTHTKSKNPGGHENVAEENELAEIQLVQKTQKWTQKYLSDKIKTRTEENKKAAIQQDEATHTQDEADKKDCLSTKTPTIRIQNETQVKGKATLKKKTKTPRKLKKVNDDSMTSINTSNEASSSANDTGEYDVFLDALANAEDDDESPFCRYCLKHQRDQFKRHVLKVHKKEKLVKLHQKAADKEKKI